jgi:hypothetical protein
MPLSADNIKDAFAALSDELSARGSVGELVIVGGAAVVMPFGARQSTKDVDAYFLRPEASIVRDAAEAVAERLGLPRDWLNDGANGYLVGLTTGDVLFDSPQPYGARRFDRSAPGYEARRLARCCRSQRCAVAALAHIRFCGGHLVCDPRVHSSAPTR